MSKIDKLYYSSGELWGVTYRNVSGEYHREDGPAYIRYYEDGSVSIETYWLNDTYHRANGPAYISYYEDGSIDYEAYFINGKRATKEQIKEIKFNKQFDKDLEEVLSRNNSTYTRE